jgi:hypothetical protein
VKERIGKNEKGMVVCGVCGYEHDPSEWKVITIRDGSRFGFCPKCGMEGIRLDDKKYGTDAGH